MKLNKILILFTFVFTTVTTGLTQHTIQPWDGAIPWNTPGRLIYGRDWRKEINYYKQITDPVVTAPYWNTGGATNPTTVMLPSINIFRKRETEDNYKNSYGERVDSELTIVSSWNGNNTNTYGITGNSWLKISYEYKVRAANALVPGGSERKAYTLTRHYYTSLSNPNVITSVKQNEENVYWTFSVKAPEQTITDPEEINLLMLYDLDDMDWIGFKIYKYIDAFSGYYYKEESETSNTGLWRVNNYNPGSPSYWGHAFVDTSSSGPWFWGWSFRWISGMIGNTFDITVGHANNRDGGMESITPAAGISGTWQWISSGNPQVYYRRVVASP